MRHGITLFSLFAVGLLACGLPDEPVPLPAMPHAGAKVPLPEDPARAFDFWAGTWSVQNKHLTSSGRWKDTGTAVARIDLVAGGRAVLERWQGEAKGDLYGFSLRSWDPELGNWLVVLNWHGGQPGSFFTMHGERNGERLELFPADGSRSARYTFSEGHEGSCQWDSAVPTNNGWITDWVMQFVRTEPARRLEAANLTIESPPAAASDYPATRALDQLIGSWVSGDGAIRIGVTSMLEGFGLLQLADVGEDDRSLLAIAHDERRGGWRAYRATSERQGLEPLAGTVEPGRIRFEGPSTREEWVRGDGGGFTWRRSELGSDGSWTVRHEVELRRAARG